MAGGRGHDIYDVDLVQKIFVIGGHVAAWDVEYLRVLVTFDVQVSWYSLSPTTVIPSPKYRLGSDRNAVVVHVARSIFAMRVP